MTAPARWSRAHRRDLAGLAVVAVVALASSLTAWWGPVQWGGDSCFYQAQTLELRGASSRAALAEVFTSPDNRYGNCIADSRWVQYSAPFYRRRWAYPAAGAAVYPLFGERSLEIVSLLGYLAAAAALFALARARFSALPSAAAAALVTLIPQFRTLSLLPLTDAWGVALEAVCLLIAILHVRHGRLLTAALWTLTVLLLAFTRDNAAVAALALLLLAVRSRRALLLGITGALAAAIPSFAFGVHYRVLLAYTLNGSQIPPSTTWSWSFHHYAGGVDTMLRNLVVPLRLGFIPSATGLAMIVGLAGLILLRQGPDPFWAVLFASIAASIVFLFSLPQLESLRISFVLLPAVAGGYAAITDRILGLAGIGRRAYMPIEW